MTRKRLVDRSVYELLARIVGGLLLFYIILKILDTLYWAMVLAPEFGLSLTDFYRAPYGMWLLVAEVLICGVVPAIVLNIPQARKSDFILFGAFFLGCAGIVINRFVMTVQAIAVPVMPFDRWQVYVPTVYEWAPGIAMLAYCALILSFSYRYLPLFPREKHLNPA